MVSDGRVVIKPQDRKGARPHDSAHAIAAGGSRDPVARGANDMAYEAHRSRRTIPRKWRRLMATQWPLRTLARVQVGAPTRTGAGSTLATRGGARSPRSSTNPRPRLATA